MSNRVLMLAIGVMASVGAAAGGVSAAPESGAVVLMYHHVDTGTPESTSLPPELFEQHLRHLEEGGFVVLQLSAVMDSLAAGAALPDRCVAITFDDGYRSVYTEAWPRLKRRGWPFTVFVSPADIDRRAGPVLTWDQMREMAGARAEVAPHGLRHDPLHRRRSGETDAQWRDRTRTELLQAQMRIVDEVGQAPGILAYPYGEFDPALQALVAELGWTAFGQHSGALGPGSDRTALPRFPLAGPYADMEQFRVKAAALPLPVIAADPAGPVLRTEPGRGDVDAPVLRLQLGPGTYDGDRLAAYAGALGRAEIVWIDREERLVEIRVQGRLPVGRHRYNVTAPATEGHRHHWYSQPWLVVGGD